MHSNQCHCQCSIQKTLDESSKAIKIANSEKKQIENNKSGSYTVYIISVQVSKVVIQKHQPYHYYLGPYNDSKAKI
jgi:hypothetical protein